MIFWIFVIAMVIGIVVILATNMLSNKYQFGFFYWNDDELIRIGRVISIVSGIIAGLMLFDIISANALATGTHAKNEQRYEALLYKAQTESIRDDKEYIDEVQDWNEYIAEYKANSESSWFSIFYPKETIEGFEIINLEEIE